ncbi:hypothetical protein Tco_1097460 [Tanacetum coccineum]
MKTKRTLAGANLNQRTLAGRCVVRRGDVDVGASMVVEWPGGGKPPVRVVDGEARVSACGLKNTKALNYSFQNEIARLYSENESLKDEISKLKKVIEEWTSSKVTLDQLLTEQVPRNIIRSLGGRGKRKDAISPREMLFTMADESPSETTPKITSDSKSECDNQDPLPPLLNFLGVEPIGTSNDEIPLADLKLTLSVPKKTKQVTEKVSSVNVAKKKTQTKSPYIKGLKEQIKPLSDNSASVSQTGSSKSAKGKKRPSMDLVNTVAVVKKTLAKLKAQSSQGSSSRKDLMIPKPYIDCKYCGFSDHYFNEYEYYPGCESVVA